MDFKSFLEGLELELSIKHQGNDVLDLRYSDKKLKMKGRLGDSQDSVDFSLGYDFSVLDNIKVVNPSDVEIIESSDKLQNMLKLLAVRPANDSETNMLVNELKEDYKELSNEEKSVLDNLKIEG